MCMDLQILLWWLVKAPSSVSSSDQCRIRRTFRFILSTARSTYLSTTYMMMIRCINQSKRRRVDVLLLGLLLVFALIECVASSAASVTGVSPTMLGRGGAAAPGALQIFVSTIKEARRHLAAAAVARSVSIFAMFPVDTIKTRSKLSKERVQWTPSFSWFRKHLTSSCIDVKCKWVRRMHFDLRVYTTVCLVLWWDRYLMGR